MSTFCLVLSFVFRPECIHVNFGEVVSEVSPDVRFVDMKVPGLCEVELSSEG